jgi:Holliday junction resolvase RusA-like endonuclease
VGLRTIRIKIPGDPVAQGRPVFDGRGPHPRAIDPKKSRRWKAEASKLYRAELRRLGVAEPFFPEGPVELWVEAVWRCPKSDERATPVPRRYLDRHKGDGSNVLKAVEDAANKILFGDDAQIARLTVVRWIGAQGEEPFVGVTVRELRQPSEQREGVQGRLL